MGKSKNKYLVIKGIAGLGNRLITLCAGIEYAKATDRAVLVDWSDGMFAEKGYNVFHDYFEIANIKILKDVRDIDHVSSVYPAGFNHNLEKGVHELFKNINAIEAGIPKLYSILNRMPKVLFSYQKPNMLREYWRYMYHSRWSEESVNGFDYFLGIFDKAHSACGRHLSKKRKEDIVIYIEYEPSYNPVTLLNHINLQSAISKQIDLFTSEKLLTHDSIGVHIRGNDRKSKTPYEKLYNLLRDKKFETKKIFLATDCIEVLENFLKEFPNTIVYPKFLPKVHERGIHYWASTKGSTDKAKGILEQSIIDIWLLSKCEYLFYQKSSSFSKIASHLHSNFHKAVNWEEY